MNSNRQRCGFARTGASVVKGCATSLLAALLTLCAWLLPQRAAATYVDNTNNYMVTMSGSNTLTITMPLLDEEDADTWVEYGKLYVSWEGQSEIEAMHWKCTSRDNHSGDDNYVNASFCTQVGGSFDITQGNSSNHFTLTASDGTIERRVYENSDRKTFRASAVWRLPYNLLGKTLTFRWEVDRDRNNTSAHYLVSGLDNVVIKVPEASAVVSPQVTIATMSYSEAGKLEIPWFIAARKLVKARYEYTDYMGRSVAKDMPTDVSSGTIYLDANEPHNNFRVIVSYLDNNNYQIDNVSSKPVDLTMIHMPMNLSATPLGDHNASVRLKWKIVHEDTEDMMGNDFFDVQRSITGDDADFVTIGSVPYSALGETSYGFIDSTLISAIKTEHLTTGNILPNVRYRVRRMCTQNWGWNVNPYAQYASCSITGIHLLNINKYTAKWEDQRAYTVRVDWGYADERNAVWDDRASMILRVKSFNRAGEEVESLDYVLTADERKACTKVINMSRPCVNFDIEMLVNQGESTIPAWGKDNIIQINSAEDWNTFVSMVDEANGNPVLASLGADITINTMAGSTQKPFVGTFFGNGHTLTLNFNSSAQFTAPFSVVSGNTIINDLCVKGNVTSSRPYSAGIVGDYTTSGKSLTISNCKSSVTVNCDVTGDASSGGLIGLCRGERLNMSNCVFDGKIIGAKSHSNGGLIGFMGVQCTGTLTNCEFAPKEISTLYNGCQTFSRVGNAKTLSLINCRYTKAYCVPDGYFAIKNADDWNTFRDMVNDANGSDVNAMLVADISITNSCGESSKPFRGTFDGNGHTLNLNIDNGSDTHASPFKSVQDVTIKNLHVTGTVKGGIHSSGLVGGPTSGTPTININNVWVSASIQISSNYVGGFVGHGGSANIYINDSRFDGTLTANGVSNSYGGAIIGWGSDNVYFYMHRVYENGTYNSINHAGFCYWGAGHAWGTNSSSTLCCSSHGWAEMKSGLSNLTDASKVVNLMNDEKAGSWELKDNKPVPVLELEQYAKRNSQGEYIESATDIDVPNVDKPVYTGIYAKPTLPTFYHESNGKIDKTLRTETCQSSVKLTWETDGNPIDYFTVLRRVKGTTDWTIVETNIDTKGYEDKTVSPLMDYEYKVRATNDCEGVSYTETNIVDGACKHTGRVSGYVRMNDGTGAAGIQIEVSHNNTRITTVTTDESGYFVADSLSYFGQQSVTYTIAPVSSNAINLEDGSYAVTFNNNSNDQTLREFVITNSHRFSGFVMYEGTSIPVKGARFRVNGRDLHNASGGYVETDFDGGFSFRVLHGVNTIQVVMPGHTFNGEGYFKGDSGYNFTEDVAQIYFYDRTRVKLTGRVVGGDVQGSLPLDNNLSRNNLGDNLTMVLTLEGDNTSWLLYDNLNPELSESDVVYQHPGGKGHNTKVHLLRKRMVVKPDSVTGEYVLMLPPVRWKVQQIYCEGYPTLFQDGMVSEVIDLTNSLNEQTKKYEGTFIDVDNKSVYQPMERYNATYSRIYHAPVEITYNQVNYDALNYFGDRTYTATTVGGDKAQVPLVYETANKTVKYTFGYPVFSLERKYPIQIAVVERYPWNGVKSSKKEDIVKIGGGKVTIHNGLKDGLTQDTLRLNDMGEGIFYLTTGQTTRLLTGKDALKTVTMTLEQDGTTYEAEPLQAYVLNMFAMGEAKDVLVADEPLLVDILRDPPGGESTATLSKGSKLKYTYTLDMTVKAGLHLNIVTGSTLDNFQATVAAPQGVGQSIGVINHSNNEELIDFTYAFDMEGHRAFTYTMNINQDITTSADHNMVGSDADLFIGLTQNMVVMPVSTIRAIPDYMYRQMLGKLGGGTINGINNQYGTLVEIAQGRDDNDSLYHLVRDVSIGYGPKVKSQFVHSQKHILTQLIPDKVKELRALMFTGTAAEAQAHANATGKPVYRSLVPADSSSFGVINMKDGKIFYYTSTMSQENGMNYVIHLPAGSTDTPDDEVAEINLIIAKWVEMVAQNEHEKLGATELVSNYDVDGGTKLTYGETFESDYSVSNYYHLPGVISGSYFDDSASDKLLAVSSIVGIKVVSAILKAVYENYVNETVTPQSNTPNGKQPYINTSVNFFGSNFKFSLLPVLDYNVKDVSGESNTYSRKESFTIAMDKKSHLNFDLYRVMTDTAEIASNGVLDVFTNRNFSDQTNNVIEHIGRDNDLKNIRYSRGFVYRTRGGATCNPWESERRSQFWDEGRIIDERTKKICNPKISLDRQSVSGVAIGDPARFKAYLTNDSEQPEAATGSLRIFKFYLEESSNPNGAKVYVDGTPLNSSGIDVMLEPGQMVQKTIEVYAGDDFDYKGLQLVLTSEPDREHVYDHVAFDVHYMRQAGAVNISVPSDKWVMNTDAQWNDERGWFMPVTISGFNKHQHNFDHIEFQYKETQRGDDYWTNLCSYYADTTLMNKASGVREMIPENGNINTQFYGEGVVMERGYDLRAVLYCRDGNSFLTTPSKVVSGIKDTRRPQLFGTPEPIDGVLTPGSNIVFPFSEDIEYNYLNAKTNFEVKGEVNNNNVTDMVSLQFSGNASVESEAQRNFSGKDVTIDMMIYPAQTGRDMPLFSHGINGKKLQLWLTADNKLRAVVDDNTYTSTNAIRQNVFTQVAMVISQPSDGVDNGLITFYNGGVEIGSFSMAKPYTGTGQLIFGRTNENDRAKSQFYEGRMMEARLWYRALTGNLVGTTYGSKRLTGYEMGLVDYYPMNEGSGNYALDKTQGANAILNGATWAMPHGLSLHVDWNDRGLPLNQNAISRTAEQDYTLMFWFKTDAEGRGVLLSNGAGRRNDIGAENQYCIAFEAEKLMYRTHGMAVEVPGDWSDGKWHHYAMTVNRSNNVANIYIDETLRSSFTADSLGGISGGYPLIGAARYDELQQDGQIATIDTRNWLKGNIDELCLFAQALPPTLINSYSTKSPNGDEAGLLTYLSFDRQERQKDNSIELVAYPYSKRLYLDDNGEIRYQLDSLTQQTTSIPVRDYLFDISIDDVMQHIDATQSAPVVPYEELKNLNFSFVGQGNKVMVNVNEPATRINRRNIYVTLRNVEDKRGNSMSSPVTACFYVRKSHLNWIEQRMTETIRPDNDNNNKLLFTLLNQDAIAHTYTIDNCPKWLTLNSYSDVVGPQDFVSIEATVNKNLNVGSYDEILYLTDEDGISEPLYLNLTVEGDQPEWAYSINTELLQNSMNVVGKVLIGDEIDIDSRDIVGVFDSDNQCHGTANISYSAQTGESNLYLTIYDNQVSSRQLYFKLWQYSTGRELLLTPNLEFTFQKGAVLGTETPVLFVGGSKYVQNFQLKQGWNWVSFNVVNEKLFNLNTLLDGLPWKNGDILSDMNSDLTLVYQNGHWLATDNVLTVRLSAKKAYAVKVQKDVKFPIAGAIIKAEDARTISLRQGWNGMGYTPMLNLPIETAMSDYYDKASVGDVIKSHDEFAYFTKSGGVGRWRGSLQYMKPGEGYMLLRKAGTDASFRYPYYEPGSIFIDEASSSAKSEVASAQSRQRATMSLSAIVRGVELQEGDCLVAYADGDVCGKAEATDSNFYMSIGGQQRKAIWFAIERDDDIMASTGTVFYFQVNAIVGSPDKPTVIDFVRTGEEKGRWYTMSGVPLAGKPSLKGVYIYNGKKIVIK